MEIKLRLPQGDKGTCAEITGQDINRDNVFRALRSDEVKAVRGFLQADYQSKYIGDPDYYMIEFWNDADDEKVEVAMDKIREIMTL